MPLIQTSFAEATQENTRAFFVESLGNPKLDVLDLEAISEHAKEARVPFIVDNTVATPALLNPIKHGANIVIHSLTKYIGGHGTSLGGAIIDAGTFDWSSAESFRNLQSHLQDITVWFIMMFWVQLHLLLS